MPIKFTLQDYLIMDGLFEPSDEDNKDAQKKEDLKQERKEARKKLLTEKKSVNKHDSK